MPLRRLLFVVSAALVLQALPSVAASGPSVAQPVLRSGALVPGSSVHALTSERMIGLTWSSGSLTAQVRWHGAGGWTPWELAEEDTGDSPEGTPGTAPLWRPAGADLVEVRTTGAVTGARLVRVSDGPVRRVRGAVASAATGRAVLGEVRSRAEWGANEAMVRHSPAYASRVSAVVVHHTANANGYSPAEVPAILRADYAYHVQTRGWADLGYNLVVDAFGGIWEGRRGGLGRATLGSHAQGFNTGTLGVAVLGDYTKTTLNHETEKALARVVAYAATTWGFEPAGSVTLTSKGSPRYASGRQVALHRVFGHQETSVTACPGSVQDRLPYLRSLAKVAMGPAPRILSTSVKGVPLHAPTPAVLEARLSLPAVWRIVISDPEGAVVATRAGSGTRPELEWNGLTRSDLPVPALPGTYRWELAVDDDFHPLVTTKGSFEVGLPVLSPPSALR